jgi:hypothetical protein
VKDMAVPVGLWRGVAIDKARLITLLAQSAPVEEPATRLPLVDTDKPSRICAKSPLSAVWHGC